MKVMTVLGTRPEIIRLSRVIAKLDKFTDHTIVHTGQNYDYELNKIFFDDLALRKPDYFLDASGRTPIQTISNLMVALDDILAKVNPDALLVLGDTNSGLAVIPAKRRKIPIFHMEAGNRCFDMRVPEEINRKIIDHTSDINLPYSTIARNYLIAEGLPHEHIVKSGSPMYEVLAFYREKIEDSSVLADLVLQPKKYFVFSTHREENVDKESQLRKIAGIMDYLGDTYGFPIILSTHPRTRKRLIDFDVKLHPLVKDLKPLGFFDYNFLQSNAYCVISDSGTITEESSILKFPAINLREVNERPEGVEQGITVMTGLSKQRVEEAIPVVTSEIKEDIFSVPDYQAPRVSDIVLRTILGYTDFVKRRVWYEND